MTNSRANDLSADDLRSELDEYAQPTKAQGTSVREQRIVAGFEEIERFVEEHGRLPQHGEQNDIFERLYAVRLDCMRVSEECRTVLKSRDPHGLLTAGSEFHTGLVRESAASYAPASSEDASPNTDELLAALREGSDGSDILDLRHVRSRDEIRAEEEVAQRKTCQDFDVFAPVFQSVQEDLNSGERRTLKYKDNADVKKGDLFIVDGQKVIVAEMGNEFVGDHGRPDRRLRVIYDNRTESDLLLRSLQRALNKDKSSRRISRPELGPLFADEADSDDLATGYIYVLRSKSEDPFVIEHRLVLHKIGVTGGDVKARIANARLDPTYLLADVEVVATFKLSNINRKRLEALLHRFFASARLDLELKDRFGFAVAPKEWFLVPLHIIDASVHMLQDGSITKFHYDIQTAQIVPQTAIE